MSDDEEGETEIRNLHSTRLRKSGQRNISEKLDFEIAQLEDAALESDNEHNFKDPNDFSSGECLTDKWTDFNVLDANEYGNLIENLNNDQSVSNKLQAVRNLINSHVINVYSKHWSKLSSNVQQCLTHSNNELYTEALKFHYKVILFRNASCEGYLSLLQGLQQLLNNRCFLVPPYDKKLQARVVQVVKILLKTQMCTIKNCTPSKQKGMEELIRTFTTLFCKEQEDNVAFEVLCTLDAKALWFANFCYCSSTRTVVLQKTTSFAQFNVSLFTKVLEDDDACLFKQSSKSNVSFLTFSHCVHFLTKYFEYDNCMPISSSNETLVQLTQLAVSKLISCVRGSKVQTLLTRFVESLAPFITVNTLDVLFEPLDLKTIDKNYTNHIAERNEYVIDIVHKIASSSRSSSILFGQFNNAGLFRNTVFSPLRTVVEFTIFCVRHCINRIEDEHQIKETIVKWLHCCKSLYSAHPLSFLIYNPMKLIMTIRDLYEVSGNYSVNLHYKMDILDMLSFFVAHHLPSIQILADRYELSCDILTFSLLTKHLNTETWLCITNVARSDAKGHDIVTNNHNKIVLPCLEQTWLDDENEINFMDGNDIEKTDASFLKTFFMISSCYRTFDALINFESEDTIFENDDKPLTLAELVASCFDTSYVSGFSESYNGLLVLKILISNANLALHLESNYRLQENLNNLQELTCTDPSEKYNSAAIIVDPITSLRHNILLSIKYFGCVYCKLNENILTQTQLLLSVPQASANLKRRDKRQSELQKFLAEAKNGLHDHSWLLQARRAFRITTAGGYNISLLMNLIDQIPKNKKPTATWPQLQETTNELYPEDLVGISIIIKFGTQAGFLSSTAQCEENLRLLIKQFRYFVRNDTGFFAGFEWFLGILFLICSGNPERTKSTALHMQNLQVFPLLCQRTINENLEIQHKFYQLIAIALEDNYSEIKTALQMLSTSSEIVARKWLGQCFFDVLPFEEICNFIAVCVLYPFEYSAYFVVAVFHHLKECIFLAAQECNFQNMINLTKIPDFKTHKHLKLMDNLAKQYKNIFDSS